MSHVRPAKRARSAIACQRCKHRKQRCDNGFPACATCVATGETCLYENNVYPEEHVETLRARVADLERQLQGHEQQHSLASTFPAASKDSNTLHQSQGCRPGAGNEQHVDEEENTAFDMLSPGPSYLGISSGFPLARAVQAVIGRTALLNHARNRNESFDEHRARALGPELPSNAGNSESAIALSESLHAYLAKVHPKHLFISPRRIFRLHESRESLRRAATPPTSRAVVARCEFFILHMVYAIGARYLQLSQEQHRCSSEVHYATAMKDMECLFETRALEAVEGLLLLAIFQLRSPSRPDVWSIIGIVMRHAVSIGLHRKFHGKGLVMDQRRKRIFWTIYMLDRSMARTLGRPVCVSDRDIDVDLPANVAVDIEGEDEMAAALQEDLGATPMSAAIHIFRLARIESKIYFTMHRVDRPFSDLTSDKVVRLRQLLSDWKDQIPASVPNANDEEDTPNYYVKQSYHVLQYHKAMLLILLPCLTRLSTTHADFRLCMASAGQVGQLYKRLHDYQSSLSYSLIALHATFVAGLTLIYCFLADRTVFDLQFSSDIRACSTVLYVISERWPAARKVRDAFERMIGNTIEKAPFHDPMQQYSQSIDMFPVNSATESFAATTGHQHADIIWSELAALMPVSSGDDNNDASFPSTAMKNNPEDLWNTVGTWFGESEDFWLEDNLGSYDITTTFPMGPG